MSKVKNELQKDPLMPLRHTAEHVLHTAMRELYPDIKLVMGPPIENGFYFDFDLDQRINEEDFPKIEAKMQEIIDAKLPMEMKSMSEEGVQEMFKDNQYKLNTIAEIVDRGEDITICVMGDNRDVDLCWGPHIDNTSGVKAFKLLSVAGAYYKGDEKNKMLQRIYGTAFDSQAALNEYLEKLELAKQRDHRKIGPQMELFMFHDSSPGSPYWLPNGLIILNELIDFWRSEHKKRGYLEIASPLINKKELWETSGHWEHYKDDMFIADMGENEIYGVKPMNCPNAMIVFGSKVRSYRDLPLRLSDTDALHRYEKSGTLHGLLRVRSFRQDDSHNFITVDQVENEYKAIFEIADLFYGIFGLEFKYRLGTRPEKFMGDPKDWDKAEEALYKILDESVGRDNYIVEEGDGAFYGPKVDIIMNDSLGREWQMGTIQLDFQQPKRFGLTYVDKDGSNKTPVVVHRVIYGSIERFIGIIIEHFGGAFPVWLSPVQVKIIPISEKHTEYAKHIQEVLTEKNLRAEIDDKDTSMGNKIRLAQTEKVPYMLIVGDKELEAKTVSVRLRDGAAHNDVQLGEFADKAGQKYLTKSLDLW